VIIGSGLTGVVISRALSLAKVPHLLIGGPPGTLPRLGESMNLDGSLAMTEWYPGASGFVFPKHAGVGYFGEHELTCEFNLRRSMVSRTAFKLLGHRAPSEFVHVDRLGFDESAYREAVASAYCTEVLERVTAIDYRPEQDAIGAITLDTGTTLSPAYVFDATNRGRAVALAAGVPCRPLGRVQRVVYTHYHRREGPESRPEQNWQHATNILRLFEPVDNLSGLAWCIPLGTYVSVGVSANVGETNEAGSDLLEHVSQAYGRRGLFYRPLFPLPREIVELEAGFFVHDRAYGRNWLLAGPAFCQIWWMASAGVGSAFAAATIAPRLLQDPIRFGGVYERYMLGLVRLHSIWDWFALTNPTTMTQTDVRLNSDRLISVNRDRLVASASLSATPLHRMMGRAIQTVMTQAPPVRDFCQVSEVANPSSEVVIAPRAELEDEQQGRAVVGKFMEVLAGEEPLGASRSYMAEDVILHVDNFTFRGRHVWMRWVSFLRARSQPGGLAIRVEETIVNPDGTITARGRWRTTNGEPRFSATVSGRYRVAGTKVAEVWTTRTNYEFVFGSICGSRIGWMVIMARMALWNGTKLRSVASRKGTSWLHLGQRALPRRGKSDGQVGEFDRAKQGPDRP
jgi:hypothetical protein